ncbi:MAG: DUF3575 domain-containing protein [Chitinophagales bacterium]|nr:DUF3575 domain-containing protein [Chitinophagales bacterium]
MKKLLLLIFAALSLTMTNDLTAQTMAAGAETGPQIFTGFGGEFWYRIGGLYQYNINETHSVKAGIDFAVGNFNLVLINPEYRYAFEETFDGFYVGGFIKYGIVIESALDGGSYFGLGATGGYEVPISDSFILDLNGQLGYASLGYDFLGFGKINDGGLDFSFGAAGKFLF